MINLFISVFIITPLILAIDAVLPENVELIFKVFQRIVMADVFDLSSWKLTIDAQYAIYRQIPPFWAV